MRPAPDRYSTVQCPKCRKSCAAKKEPVDGSCDPFICFRCNWVQGFGLKSREFVDTIIEGKILKYTQVKEVICPYCNGIADLVHSSEVYGKGHDYGYMYLCKCMTNWAYVGCHKGTITPLGRLADAQLRDYKKKTHFIFDPLWKKGKMSRSKAYSWLANQLGIPTKECHIGMFDVNMCEKVIEICLKEAYE